MKCNLFGIVSLLVGGAFNVAAQTVSDFDNSEVDGACVGNYDASTKHFYNTALIPHMFLSSNRLAHIIIQNTSDQNLKFFYEPTYFSESAGGAEVSLSNESYYGGFSSTNSPKSTSGALLAKNTAGRINVPYQSSNHEAHVKLYWATEECLTTAPIVASLEMQYYVSSPTLSGITYVEVNNGQSW